MTEEKALAKVQRKISKLVKGTPERAKALKAVQRVHERIANKREDFVQKMSLGLIRTYDLITFEDLNVKGVTKNHCLAKHIADIAWCKLTAITSYKAEYAGKRVELVNPCNTLHMCSGCDQKLKKTYWREYTAVLTVVLLLIEIIMSLSILRLGLRSVAKA
ncbi:MAG: transposase [Methanosarcina sp.]|nr:transposase [Methanosarcina sp.]